MSASASLLIAAAVLGLAGREGVPLQYLDSRGREPSQPRSAQIPDGSGYTRSVAVERDSSRGDRVVLIVDESVSGGIAASLATFEADLESEGWTVEVWTVTDPSASALRTDLQSEYAQGELRGALLIGNIPAGWVEASGGEYPVDLFLMDMNGTWTDSDMDGLYESWANQAPEIWVGRLTPTWLSFGSSVELLENYFAKNHAYRSGTLSLPDRALAYEEAFTGLTGYIDMVYDDVTTKSDPAGTTADDFRAELLNGYEWVHLIAHSSPWGSSFHTGAPPAGAGTFNSYEAVPLDPHAFFYILNCCTNGRWTEIDNLANLYIWADTYGIAVVAQAKTDYTNDFYELYQTLGNGQCLGEAFRVWLSANLALEHAAVLLGDPTLRPHGNGQASAVPQGSHPALLDGWRLRQITDGLHSEGDLSVCREPVSGELIATFGSSDPVRANIMATVSEGDTWMSPVQICEHEYWDWHPAIGADGSGNAFLAWHSMHDDIETYDIYVSTWNGSSWSAETRLTETPAFETGTAVAGRPGRCWVVWQQWDAGDTDISGRMWTGSAWTTTTDLAATDYFERSPSIASSSSGFGLAYQAWRSGALAICFRDAPDSGPFGPETVISLPGPDCREPSIAGDPGAQGYLAAWECDGEILASRRDGGAWSAPVTLSSSGSASRPCTAVLAGARPAVCWIEQGGQVWVSFYDGSAWTAPGPVAAPGAVESVAASYKTPDLLEILFGARGGDLHWDIWVADGDPLGFAEDPSGQPQTELRLLANPSARPVAFLVSGGSASIDVFDLSGRRVAAVQAAQGTVSWDGCSSEGEPLPAGAYLVRACFSGSESVCRLVLLP